MSGIYMVSAQKPTAVTHSILGRVTCPLDLNLIICKNTLLEIYKVTPEGLKFVKQIGIWGVIENLNTLKLKNEKKDSILITTCKHDIMILSCEKNGEGTYEILTRSHGNFKDTIPRSSSTHMITAIEYFKHSPVIAIKCYDGLLKTIPINNESKQLNVSTIRMEDLNVIDLVFLEGYDNPTISVVCKWRVSYGGYKKIFYKLFCDNKEPNQKLHLKAYEIDTSFGKDLTNLLWKKEILDSNAFLIPVSGPLGGVLVVGCQSISYYNKFNESIQKSPYFLSQGEITCYALIDMASQRYLISNNMGNLFLMILIYENGSKNTKVSDIHFETLGETAIADNITYIDNGVVFIGSKLGDSQLIKLVDMPRENGSFIEILETYTNLGPILDMLIVDIEKQGQGQLITCSGGHRNGSLRIIRSGIGIQEMANVELSGIKALWAAKIFNEEFDDHLVLSFYGYTKIFSFTAEEFEDVEIDGFDLTNQTLLCSNVQHQQFLQVTSTSVNLIKTNPDSMTPNCKLVAEWKIPAGEFISIATCNPKECLIACRNQIHYIIIENEQLVLKKSKELEYEIACLDIHSFKDEYDTKLCGVGLWGDISARLLKLPNLEEVCAEQLKGDVIPRSILIESLEGIPYLFVSLGDGSVINFIINKSFNASANKLTFELIERRKVVLGTQPTILKKFRSYKPVISNNIFACSDRPSVISSANQKLVYSSVNLKQVEYMCEINAKAYPASLALLSAGTLRIGTMDSIQKLHIRSVQLNETARRISYQTETQTFGIITFRIDMMSSTGELKPSHPSASTQCANQQFSKSTSALHLQQTEMVTSQSQMLSTMPTSSKNLDASHPTIGQTHVINSFLVLDQNTFEVLHSVQLQISEFAISILSMSFENDPTTAYYVIGCCFVNDDDPEPKMGRILVFRLNENKLVQICEKEIKGAPYCMQNFNGKLLVSISNSLKLYEFKDNQLNQLASHSDNVFIIHLKCKNDFILTGDMMKSCAVLTYRADSNSFETVARDNSPVWLSSIEMIDDDNFLLSDCFQNVITLKKDSGQSNEDERKSLQNFGSIHLGEQINVFRHGSLGMQQQSNELLSTHFQCRILSGTVSGSIILFAQLSNTMFKILNELQTRLSKFYTTAGKIPYEKWRDFDSERRVEPHKFFIDGDLIETFLELSSAEASNLIKDFKIDNSTLGHSNEEFSVNYFNKLVEELSRIH